jgi:hypothetical protein
MGVPACIRAGPRAGYRRKVREVLQEVSASWAAGQLQRRRRAEEDEYADPQLAARDLVVMVSPFIAVPASELAFAEGNRRPGEAETLLLERELGHDLLELAVLGAEILDLVTHRFANGVAG